MEKAPRPTRTGSAHDGLTAESTTVSSASTAGRCSKNSRQQAQSRRADRRRFPPRIRTLRGPRLYPGPSSPAFIAEVELGKTLCIPSIFVSYTGSARKKLPLLRSDGHQQGGLELIKAVSATASKKRVSTCGLSRNISSSTSVLQAAHRSAAHRPYVIRHILPKASSSKTSIRVDQGTHPQLHERSCGRGI